MNLSEFDISNPYRATLISTERLTPENAEAEVRHLTLEIGEESFDFVEGQSIGVLLPGPHEFGNPHHFRLYSIASSRRGENGRNAISICVRRCFFIDEISGERYPGKASNFLCDARPGAVILITGPYGSHFKIPDDSAANLLMVGAGTGIAPFRSFVKHIYEERGGWKGKVRLYYGAKTGLELLYMNERNRDLALYYDEATFRAFQALSPRPHFDQPPAIDQVLIAHSAEVWEMVQQPQTYVYLAGLESVAEKFEQAMTVIAGSEEAWRALRKTLVESGRYSELLY